MAIRLCTYNIEWFDRLFDTCNSLKTGAEEMCRLDFIAAILRQIDADLVGIVEAPDSRSSGTESCVVKLENFASHYTLRTCKALCGFISRGQQQIALLFDPDVLSVTHQPGGSSDGTGGLSPRFDGVYHYDADDDGIEEIYRFYRPPLEAKVRVKATANEFRLIEVHTKSKGIFNSVDMIHLERRSRSNRMKIYAECSWIRRRVDEWFDEDQCRHVIVMGDINDGPGMDQYEMRYGKSGVEIIMGSLFEPERVLRNYAGRPRWGEHGWSPATATFKDRITGSRVDVMIDHILVSAGIRTDGAESHRVWNPYEDSGLRALQHPLLQASDHFPVSIDLCL